MRFLRSRRTTKLSFNRILSLAQISQRVDIRHSTMPWIRNLTIWRFRTRAFDFAVDFGTTNTHIEYSENGNNPKPLEINASNPFILKLSNYSFDSEEDKDKLYDKAAEFLLQTVPQEFIPEAIGRAEDFSFPMRWLYNRIWIWEDCYTHAQWSPDRLEVE